MTNVTPVSSENSGLQYSDLYDSRPEEGFLYRGETEPEDVVPQEQKKCVAVGDSLPYGPRLYYGSEFSVVRMKDIGEKNRILLLGVVGSFTPDCWNRHLFRVLNKMRYYSEREIDYICCLSTNDAYTQRAWGEYLGCDDSVLMLSDSTKRFTKAMGMDIVVPWLDNTVRSKRYVIYAEDMVISKMIVSESDGAHLKWECEHLEETEESFNDDDSDSWI